MKKPHWAPTDVHYLCLSGMGARNKLRSDFAGCLSDYSAACSEYEAAAGAASLNSLPSYDALDSRTTIAGFCVRKAKKLYEKNFVPDGLPTRPIYESLINSGGKRCPYCAGIRDSANLDHYLPKSKFPRFTITLSNLVPSCRDCNMGYMKSDSSISENEQLLHPYFDADHFFNENWIYAEVPQSDRYAVRFYAKPPDHWTVTDQERALNHFEKLDLDGRFSSEAAAEVSSLFLQRMNGPLKGFDSSIRKEALLADVNHTAYPVNHWRPALYKAFADSDWYLQSD